MHETYLCVISRPNLFGWEGRDLCPSSRNEENLKLPCVGIVSCTAHRHRNFPRCPFVFGARFCTTGARTYGDEPLVTNRTAGFFTSLVPIWSEWCAKYAKTASQWHWWIAFLFAVNPGTAAIATTCMTCGGNGVLWHINGFQRVTTWLSNPFLDSRTCGADQRPYPAPPTTAI